MASTQNWIQCPLNTLKAMPCNNCWFTFLPECPWRTLTSSVSPMSPEAIDAVPRWQSPEALVNMSALQECSFWLFILAQAWLHDTAEDSFWGGRRPRLQELDETSWRIRVRGDSSPVRIIPPTSWRGGLCLMAMAWRRWSEKQDNLMKNHKIPEVPLWHYGAHWGFSVLQCDRGHLCQPLVLWRVIMHAVMAGNNTCPLESVLTKIVVVDFFLFGI